MNNSPIIKNLKGLVVCSSSSVITKRFANNDFDKELVKSLSTKFPRKIIIGIDSVNGSDLILLHKSSPEPSGNIRSKIINEISWYA
mgnify:CR=1 FL=1